MKAENLPKQSLPEAEWMPVPGETSLATLAHNWWAVLLRGILGVAFGIVTLFAPVVSLAAVVLVYGAYAFADGVFAIVSAIRRRTEEKHWWALLADGILGVGVGLVTFFWPGITLLALVFMIAAWALLTGGLEVAAAIRLRKVLTHEWLLTLAGVASIVLGLIFFISPAMGAITRVLWVGAYAFIFGLLPKSLTRRDASVRWSMDDRVCFSPALFRSQIVPDGI
jgi:uncharacterized membrane protein HdeD (DUF308 family)